MSQFTDQRNEGIRKKFKQYCQELRRSGQKKFVNAAVERLVHEYNAFDISFDTMRQICTNPNYGKKSSQQNAENNSQTENQ